MLATIIYGIGAIVESLVGLRFLFRLLGANPDSNFVHFIYNASTPLVTPFAGVFGQDAAVVHGTGVVTTGVFDWSALVAVLVYGLILTFVGRAVAR